MKKKLLLSLALLFAAACIFLCACGETADVAAEPSAPAEPSPESAPETTPEPVSVTILGTVYTEGNTFIDLSDMTDDDTSAVCEAIKELKTVRFIDLLDDNSYTPISLENLSLVQAAAPEA